MTGREKILRAFDPAGTPEIGVVASYDKIFTRDHWSSLAGTPWLKTKSDLVDKETAWAVHVAEKSGLEWWTAIPFPSRTERLHQMYEERQDGLWIIDTQTGEEGRCEIPVPGGVNTGVALSKHTSIDSLPTTREEIDALIPLDDPFDRAPFLDEGRADVALSIRDALDRPTYGRIASPLWVFYNLFGYEGMMIFLVQDRPLASYAAERNLQNIRQRIRMISALGADMVWIEELLMDQIGPDLFESLNIPLIQRCVEEIRAQGMKSIYYHTGDIGNRMDAMLSTGADALHFEESKKGFIIDIEDVVEKVAGRCVVFGNLDSYGILETGSEEELRSEIKRQLDAGKKNGNRFVMSTGSPITPGTPVERVRLYTDIVREMR